MINYHYRLMLVDQARRGGFYLFRLMLQNYRYRKRCKKVNDINIVIVKKRITKKWYERCLKTDGIV